MNTKKDYRFKTSNIIIVPAYSVMLAILTALLVMSVNGLKAMGPEDNKSMQIFGIVFFSVIIFLLLIALVNALVFRVTVDGNTVEVRKVFGTKKMDIHVGVKCTVQIESVGGGHRSYSKRWRFTLDDGTNKIKFTLYSDYYDCTFSDILMACGARIDKI